MKTIALTSLVSLFTLAAALTLTPPLAAQSERDQEESTARMIAALELHEGSIVAEMGAGSGRRTIDIAKHVGASGRVYTTELGDDRVRTLRAAVEKSGAKNVTVLPAHATKTNLEEGCCDALYMEQVYHHIEDPTAMNASIFRTVKPGGRVAIVDFVPDNGKESADPKDRDQNPTHGVLAATVQAELERAGFEKVKVEKIKEHGFILVMRKPSTTSAAQGSE
jgi:predicted methyltransferase